jgi:hypothetical protein
MDNQTQPIEDGHDDAGTGEKIEGLLEQTRQDITQGHIDDPAEVLRQRLNDGGLTVSDEEFDALVRRLG